MREAKVMQANHENIVRLYGLVQFDSGIGLVMEYMHGGELLSLLDSKDVPLTWPFRLRVCNEISSGLAYLHGMVVNDKNIIHGDLKPANVLLDGDCHAKLADFGSSTVASVTSTAKNMSTQAQAFTPAYCAPEVFENPFYTAKPSSDMFSFGMTVYYILFREVPLSRFSGGLAEIKRALLNGKRPPINDINKMLARASNQVKNILKTVTDVMKRCWKTQEKDRMSSFDAREALTTALHEVSEEDIYKTVSVVKKNRGKISGDNIKTWVPLSTIYSSSAGNVFF